MPKTIIRKANISDIDALVSLLRELFSVERDFTFNRDAQSQGLKMMLDHYDNRCIMVAERDHQTIGMCSAQLLISTAEGGCVAWVEDMVIKSSFRGKGIGCNLLSSVEKWAQCRGVRRLQLVADRNNLPALKFYEKMNWKTTELICLRKK